MRILFLSPDEPFYLPALYEELLPALKGHEASVAIVPALYKGTSTAQLALRYLRAFGLVEFIALSTATVYYKLMNKLGMNGGGKYYSLPGFFDKNGIKWFPVEDLNSADGIARLRDENPDLVISVSCPQLFGPGIINLAPKGCLNLHGSILPDYRGVMPSFWMLANGEKKAGVTLFFVNDKIDAGEVLVQEIFDIPTTDTLDSFIRRSKSFGAKAVAKGIEKVASGEYTTQPLDTKAGRYFGWPDNEAVKRFRAAGRAFR